MRAVMAATFIGLPLILLMLGFLSLRLDLIFTLKRSHSSLLSFGCFLSSGCSSNLSYSAVGFRCSQRCDVHSPKRAVSLWSKRGNLCLYLPSAVFPIDLTIYMDVQRNPGPSNQLWKFNAYLCRENIYHINTFDHSSHLPSGFRFMYSPSTLCNLSSYTYISLELRNHLKAMCVLKRRRGNRGGRRNGNKIPVRIKARLELNYVDGISANRRRCLSNLVTVCKQPFHSSLNTSQHDINQKNSTQRQQEK